MLRIAEAREARGWSQEMLAQAIGTTQQSVQRWESGQVDPKVSRIRDISRALGITVSFILGLDDDNMESDLTKDEAELVCLYRNMSKDGREHVMKTARICSAVAKR